MSEVLVNAVNERNDVLRLFTRTGAFEFEFPDHFYLTPADAEKLPPDWSDCVAEPYKGFCRVVWPESVRKGGSRGGRLKYFNDNLFKPLGIVPLEADVDPVQRFLIENPKVQIAQDWRWLWYDLETEPIEDWGKPWRSRILSFSWRSSTGERGHERLVARTDAAERDLARRFAYLADRHDILLAWNGANFDHKVVAGRMTLLDVPFDPELYHWLDHLWLFKRYFQRSEDGAVTQSYALESVAEALLGTERKVPIRKRAYELGWRANEEDLFIWTWANRPELLEEYNDQDVDLMALVEEKTGFVALHLGLCHLCRNLPNRRSQYPSTQIDGRMLMQGWSSGYHFRSKIRSDEEYPKQARGAYVPEAVTGLHESVAVVDYSRMYPSIIRTFNMSPETLTPGGSLVVPETTPHGRPTGEVLARFKAAPEGHLPAALRAVLEERKQYEERMDAAEVGSDEWYDAQRLSQALKIAANTFYGVILSPVSRYYVQEIGESVTSVGRFLLAQTLECVERRGHKFVLGDTDSVGFVATDEEAKGVEEEMNRTVIPELLANCGVKGAHPVELGYEKRFRRILVTASKKYAGIFALYKGRAVTDPDSPIDVRGMEIVRSDVCVAARKLQKAVLELMLRYEGTEPDEMWEWIETAKARFLGGASEVDDLVLRKAITKPIDQYATKPVQAKVAEQMFDRGMEVWIGSKIQFLMTNDGPIIPEDLEDSSDLDLGLLWNQYVYAPTLRCLAAAFPDYQWDGFKIPRGEDPNQLDLFDGGRPRVKRGVDPAKANGASSGPGAGVETAVSDQSNGKAMSSRKKVRRVKRANKPGLLFKVDGNWERARQLEEVVSDYPGDLPIRFEIDAGGAVVEMTSTLTARSPDEAPKFSRALSKLGVRWTMAGR